ncbi:SDR family oxidoreductase [Ferrovibrio sp.]|uniref:SDR family NAD(P)-dependent oxidoreductase n=1 Tax=Ferrovibrio sp. TaxID=1917215 RepID=UPI00311E5E97
MDGKICIVTGAAGSLGLAAAALLRREGGRVMLVDLEEAALRKAADTLGGIGDGVAICAADVADATATRHYIAETAARWGKADVLFSNAGLSGVISPVTDYPEEVFDRVMAVNVRASFLACKYGLPQMKDGGSIVITASVVGVTSDPGICAYATSKHAVIGLMRTVAKEAAPRNIRVNVLAPGPVDNGFQLDIEKGLSAAIGRDATRFLDSIIPLGRHGRADEIARAVLFLASDQSSFTTGSVLMADGGMHI